MHQKKPETQIGKESRGISSDLNPISPFLSPPIHQKQFQIQSQSHSQSHSHIQSNPHQSTSHFFPNQFQPHPNQNQNQDQFQHEPISNNSSKGKTLHSTPHKRPIMIQSPSSLSHSPSLSSVNHYNHKTLGGIQSSSQSCSCFTAAYLISLSQKLLALKVFRAHYHFVILLSLPSLYYFVSSPSRCFILDFLALLAFLAALLISLNLALPRLPSIRLFFARSFPIKFCSSSYASKPSHPVIWSIGSKPKSVKKPNSGSWEQVYRNGDVYEGEFHKGKCSGSGVYYYHMSGRYEGDWIDEKYDGYGVETWAKGSRYRGQYRQGLRHGIGVYRFYTGDVYAGEWSNGQCHGSGVYTCQDGSHYVGEFKWGVKHGLGHYHFRNGDTYAGEYFADKMHGFGVYQFGNGHRYEGAWHEGRRQGLGMYTFRNGETQSGHWQNGVLDIPCMQLTHPESPYAVNYTKVLNAVKEAQKAAEKAFNAGKVDERVKKAVAAANKAANAARVAAVKAVQNQMRLSNNNDGTPIPSIRS